MTHSSSTVSPSAAQIPHTAQRPPVPDRPDSPGPSGPFAPRVVHAAALNTDGDYLDAAEQYLLEEIQRIQKKLTESRQRFSARKNRGLLRRNPSLSDALFAEAHRPAARQTPPVDRTADRQFRQRIISVSFRLPTIEDRASVRQQLFDAGLPPKGIFALHDASDLPFVWVGAADGRSDTALDDLYGQEHRTQWRSYTDRDSRYKRKRSRYVPVLLPDEPALLRNYNTFTENTLWSLLHHDYGPVSSESDLDHNWNAYRIVNQRFAEAISEIYEDGDLIWVHNYHLMLLPSLLRESLWYAKIGFFLYTPFPTAELFRILPFRQEILRGIIGADLVGFYSYDYSKQFVASCTRLLGLDGTPSAIEADPRAGRRCELGIYPGGIDVRALKNHVSSKVVKSRVAELRARFEGRKIVVGVDRLDDCFAGIPNKLLAFEQLLTENPSMVGEVVLVQVAMIPKQARNLASYRMQQMQVNEFVGRINSAFGTFAFSPVHYINAELEPAELHALMCIGHVCVVSTVRDGMGLVPHEWTVCQHGGFKGPIVLSEFAGAAHSFSTALHVNPWNVDELAAKIKLALDMGEASRHMRNDAAYRFVTSHTANLWGLNFLEDLELSEGAQVGAGSLETQALDFNLVLQSYTRSSRSSLPSPVSSSTVLSSLNTAFPQVGISAQSGSVTPSFLPAFGPSPGVSAFSPDRGERPGDIALGEAMSRAGLVSPPERPEYMKHSMDMTMSSFRRKKKGNLFVLDVDGTLVPFQAIPELGMPTSHVIDVIQRLREANPLNYILLISSRDRNTVSQWLGNLDVFLAAEDGAYLRMPGSSSWMTLFRDKSTIESMLPSNPRALSQSKNSSFSSSQGPSNSNDSINQLAATVTPQKKANCSCSQTSPCNSLGSSDFFKARKGSFSSTEEGKSAQVCNCTHVNGDGLQNGDNSDLSWKAQVLPIMQHFAERTPGVWLEIGDASLTWHYTDSEKDFGRWQSRDLTKHLESFLLQHLGVDVISEEGRSRWVKVRPNGVDKTLAVIQTIKHIQKYGNQRLESFDLQMQPEEGRNIDFVLCIGDDRTDESMFDFFRDEARLSKLDFHCPTSRIFTCRVGSSTTSASACLEGPVRVLELLEELSVQLVMKG